MSLAELCSPWKGDTRSPMAPSLTLCPCEGTFVLPFSARPGKFLSTSLAVSVPRWHGMLRPLESYVDMSEHLWYDLWLQFGVLLGLNCSWYKYFFCLNHHRVWVLLDKAYSTALIWEEIFISVWLVELDPRCLRRRSKFSGLSQNATCSCQCVGLRGVGEKFTPSPSSDYSDFGEVLPIIKSLKPRLVSRKK